MSGSARASHSRHLVDSRPDSGQRASTTSAAAFNSREFSDLTISSTGRRRGAWKQTLTLGLWLYSSRVRAGRCSRIAFEPDGRSRASTLAFEVVFEHGTETVVFDLNRGENQFGLDRLRACSRSRRPAEEFVHLRLCPCHSRGWHVCTGEGRSEASSVWWLQTNARVGELVSRPPPRAASAFGPKGVATRRVSIIPDGVLALPWSRNPSA